MGTTYSLQKNEESTWNYHCLLFDAENRETNLELIDRYFPENVEIQLAKRDVSVGGLKYQQFFITDMKGTHFLELSNFDSSEEQLYESFRVQCNTLPRTYVVCGKTEPVTPEIKERMSQMLGMCNYSLCLRNSEHVANYIFNGKWVSFQMEEKGQLYEFFRSEMTDAQLKKINIFPSTIPPKTIGDSGGPKLYSMIDKQYVPKKFQYFSDADNTSYNVLVVGKSN